MKQKKKKRKIIKDKFKELILPIIKMQRNKLQYVIEK